MIHILRVSKKNAKDIYPIILEKMPPTKGYPCKDGAGHMNIYSPKNPGMRTMHIGAKLRYLFPVNNVFRTSEIDLTCCQMDDVSNLSQLNFLAFANYK
jgi:hypothetical protein